MNTAQLPRLKRTARVTSSPTSDGNVFALDAPGARTKRFTERGWRALCLLETVDSLDAWHAAVSDPKITKERLLALLEALGGAGLLEARDSEDVERTALHVVPGSRQGTPSFELFSGENTAVSQASSLLPDELRPEEALVPANQVQTAVASADLSTATQAPFEMDVSGANASGLDAVLAEPGAVRQRRLRRVKRAAAVGAACIGLLVLLGLIKQPLVLTYEFELTPIEARSVRAQEGGIVKAIHVDEGSVVEAGAVVAVLESSEKLSALAQNTALLEKARAQLAMSRGGSRPEEIDKARVLITGIARELTIAQGRAVRTRALVAQGIAPAAELDAARSAAAALSGRLAQARAELALLKSPPRPEEIRMLEAEADALAAKVEAQRQVVEALTVRAPIAGVNMTARPRAKEGSRVEAGETIIELARTERMIAEILVAERDLDAVHVGLPVRAKVTAFPTDSFPGSVTQVGQQIETLNGRAVVRVQAILDNPECRLVPKMTGFAEIDGEPRSLLGLLSRRLVRWVRVRFLV